VLGDLGKVRGHGFDDAVKLGVHRLGIALSSTECSSALTRPSCFFGVTLKMVKLRKDASQPASSSLEVP
jgi:hypothetical protein